MTPVSPPEVNCPNDPVMEIGWSRRTTHSAVQGSPWPEGTEGAAARAATGAGTSSATSPSASVQPPRPTAGWYPPAPSVDPAVPGQSRPAWASGPHRDERGTEGQGWAESDEKHPWLPGKDRINVPVMAIATRRLQAPVVPPSCPGDRPAAGLRRAGGAAPPSRADGRDAERRVMEAAVDAGDLAATIEAIAGLTGSAVVLQDRFLAVLASGPGAEPGHSPSAVALTRSATPLVRDLLRAGAGRPALVELPRHGGTPARLVAQVTARGEVLGFLVAGAVDRSAYATLEAAAPVVALLLQAEERLCRLLDQDQRELFLDLLAGRSADCLVLQGRRLGHDLEQPHWPLVFRAGEAPDRLETVVGDVLRAATPAGRPAAVVGVDGEAVIVFLPAGHPDGPASVAGRVRREAVRRGLPVVAGWGPRCDDLGSFGAGVARG